MQILNYLLKEDIINVTGFNKIFSFVVNYNSFGKLVIIENEI